VSAERGRAGGPLVFIVAGEPSGDALGGRIMAAMRAQTGDAARFAGVGGPAMAAQGLIPLFGMGELSVMGVSEVARHLPRLFRRLHQAVDGAETLKPDVVVTIDAPDFNLRLARRLRHLGCPLVHVVAPSVWAWRPGRARAMARVLDHLVVLLPFEPPYFDRVGLANTFVGHPVTEEGIAAADGAALRRRLGVSDDRPLLAVLPGSRSQEAERLMPVFRAAYARLRRQHPSLHAVIPAAPAVADEVMRMAALWRDPVSVVAGAEARHQALMASRAALAASGTVVLEVAAAGLPMVVAYKVAPLTGLLGHLLIRVPHVSLVNLVAGEGVVPERLQERCHARGLARELDVLLRDEAARTRQIAACRGVIAKLDGQGEPPSRRAARAILAQIGRGRTPAPA